MTETQTHSSSSQDYRRLLDENEQLRTALESALEEHSNVTDDRDHLLRRVSLLFRELQAANSVITHAAEPPKEQTPVSPLQQQVSSEAEEELRVAFEELQVLTEELEVANASLHETNRELDQRVEERTRQIAEMNAALRQSEATLRTVTDLVPSLLWRADKGGQMQWYNKRWYDYTGQDLAASLGHGWLDAVHPADRAVSRTGWTIAIAKEAPYQREHRIRGADGEYRWFLLRGEPLRDEGGDVTHWFGSGTDIHDQRVAMEALQQSETRFRTLVEGMPQLVWRAIGLGKWTWSSPQWSEYTGLSEEASRVTGWLRAFHPDDRAAAETAWREAETTSALDFEGRIYHAAEDRYRHFRTRATAVRGDKGHILEWLGTSTDIDDVLQLSKRQEIMVAELQHRTGNLMAVVQAVLLRTIKGSSSLEEFHGCIEDRMQALARVQGLLSQRPGGNRVAFDELLLQELSAHVELDERGNGTRVSTSGPRGIPLLSSTVQTFALAIHELVTNASKYGALAAPAGHLDICWELIRSAGAEPRLHVEWREHGVTDLPSPGEKPRGSGYGRELIERALPYQLGASTSYGFEPDGVHCTIELVVPADDLRGEKVYG